MIEKYIYSHDEELKYLSEEELKILREMEEEQK